MAVSVSSRELLIEPRWRRSPGTLERAAAVLLLLVPLAGLVLLTVSLGSAPLAEDLRRGIRRADEIQREFRREVRDSLRLSAESASRPGLPASYSRGRAAINRGLAGAAEACRRRAGRQTMLACAALGTLLGLAFCFFGWPLRRATSVLFGAANFGLLAFSLALGSGLRPTAAVLASLAPAFLGAVIGWHLLVYLICAYAGLLAALPAAAVAGMYDPRWTVPAALAAMAAVACLTYLFMIRAVLISSWSFSGAVLLTAALSAGLFAWRGVIPPWEALLAAAALFGALGTLTQYRLAAQGASGGSGGGSAGDGPPARRGRSAADAED